MASGAPNDNGPAQNGLGAAAIQAIASAVVVITFSLRCVAIHRLLSYSRTQHKRIAHNRLMAVSSCGGTKANIRQHQATRVVGSDKEDSKNPPWL